MQIALKPTLLSALIHSMLGRKQVETLIIHSLLKNKNY